MNHPLLRLFDGKDDTSPELQDDVKELQTDLNRFGFSLQVDGSFGSETEAAVHQFQMDHGLVPDGIVGPQTWAALEETQPPDPTATFPTTISGSNPAMQADFAEAIKFKVFINAAAQKIGVDPVVVGGIGSRESRWGLSIARSVQQALATLVRAGFPPPFEQAPCLPTGEDMAVG
jgi:hypothetical protein